MIRVTVNMSPKHVDLLDEYASSKGESRAQAGGELLEMVLELPDLPGKVMHQVQEEEQPAASGAARTASSRFHEVLLLRAENDMLRERIDELRNEKGYYQGLLAQSSREKEMILQVIPQLPPVQEAPRSWWDRFRKGKSD